MDGIKFKGSLWKVSRDHQDEVTLILKVPASDAIKVIAIPTETTLNVEITGEYDNA